MFYQNKFCGDFTNFAASGLILGNLVPVKANDMWWEQYPKMIIGTLG
jgi:hypothetical protein